MAAGQHRPHVGVPQQDQAVVAEDLLDLGALGLVRADHQHAAADDLAVLERGGLADGGGDAAADDRDLHPLAGGEDVERLAPAADVGARHRLHLVHHGVVVGRIVMKQHEALHAGGQGDVDGVLDAAVPPADLVAVLVARVLRVVDHEIGAAQEGDVALVARMLRHPARGVPERLVVGRVDHGGAVAGHAVRDGGRGVVHELRLDQHVAHAEEALVQLREVDPRAQVAHLHREVRVLHLPGHRFLEAALEAERRVDVQLRARQEGGDEEGEALDVVPVGVADEEVQAHGPRHRLGEMQPELARAGAAVEDDDRAVGGTHLDAGGVAAVAGGPRPGRGDRAASAPETHVHSEYSYHNACRAAPAIAKRRSL